MKILLLSVLNTDVMAMVEEIGICYIASYMREKGHDVMLSEAPEGEINYGEIMNFKPDLVGLSVYSVSKSNVYRVIVKLKQMLEGVLVCVGCIVPTCNGEEMLEENHEIDFAIKGEGELVFEQLVKTIESRGTFDGIAGLVYRKGDTVITNKGQQYFTDLDKLPFPARDLLQRFEEKNAYLSTIRGCRGKCTFCASHLYQGKLRMRSAKNVVDEIEYLYNNLSINTFSFTDGSFEDSLDGGVVRIREIADEIIRRKLLISYTAFIRADFYKKVDDELMSLLIKSGLCCVFVGIEAGNEADLKLYNKLATLQDNYNIIEYLRKHGLNFFVGFINFNPYSTFDTLEKNIRYLEKVRAACSLFCLTNKLTFYNGTSIYKKVKNDPCIKIINDSLDYEFADERIMTFYKRLTRILNQDKKYGNPLMKINKYVCQFGAYLGRGYKFATDLHDDVMLAIIDEIRLDRNKLISQFNNHIAKWYRRLLYDVETGSDESNPDDYYSALLFNHGFLEAVNKIVSHMAKFKNHANKEENRYNYNGHYINW
jgi:Fe-S oxidoreductase